MLTLGIYAAAWLVLWFAPLAVVVWLASFLVSLPLRRQERARFFLDLLELGLKEGRSPEQSLVAVSRSRDTSMGVRFHLIAAHVETGLRLGQALDRVPGFLPPRINAMLKAGEDVGDVSKVLPACRQLLKDGSSQARGAMNYVIVLVFVLTPAAPAVFLALSVFVFPKFLAILADMEVPAPPFTTFVIAHSAQFASIMTALALALYLAALLYLGGPRLAAWLKWRVLPVADWLACRLPWQRKRMQRDFAALLGILLDAQVPEERAVALAASGTANTLFQDRAMAVGADLRAGVKLPEAMRRLDDNGEFRWRLTNASHSSGGFRSALQGWLEVLDARAFQQQQAAAHLITTTLVLVNGVLVGLVVVGVFEALLAIINAGVMW